jgi:CRISPR-associated exonuclease Cas4
VTLLAAALLLLAPVALAVALLLRRRTGLPWARVVASDADAGKPLQKPLFARRYGLTGKPDYLLQRGGALIPVEVKPTRRAPAPYDSDLFQLAAYCLLVEEASDQAPPYGLLRYADATFRLDYTPAVRADLLDLLREMQAALAEDDELERSHNDARRCRGCGFFEQCDEALRN